MNFISIIFWTISFFVLLFMGGFAVVSLKEREKRAARISASITILITAILLIVGFLSVNSQIIMLLIIVGLIGLSLILFLFPSRTAKRVRDDPENRFDERDIMFARNRLIPGTENYNEYYSSHPENEPIDNLFRVQPGLLSQDALYSDSVLFALPKASFALTENMGALVEGEPAPKVTSLPENPALSNLVKSLTRYLGAKDVGITLLKPFHIYSHVGRGSGQYGSPIDLEHDYAIAFTVEMDSDIMAGAPHAPVTMESARQYVDIGRIAIQLAQMIRNWGYPARAHIDGDYRVICPLVARDAGLGEIGRMGLLMTPRLGPRVRIAVVTTNLELSPDTDHSDATMIDFCTICGKCAHNCPPKAIPFDDRLEFDGAYRWKIDSNLCFRYWSAIGTDCGRCMSVCPYSHPDSFYHNLVRWGIRRSRPFRQMALWMDDFLYGKEPEIRINNKFISVVQAQK